MVKIAIYDDNKARRESLEALINLTAEYQFCGSYANCCNILEECIIKAPDLILMDIEMPVCDGLQGLLVIKKEFQNVKVIMQTAFDDDEKVFTALKLGAEGYILKSASIAQIKQSIDEVMNGGAFMTPSIALKVMRHFNNANVEPSYNLSPKETEVIKHLANGLSYKMIADQMGIAYFTVNNHIKKIYEKLQVHSIGEAVAIAHRNKIV